MVYGFLALAFAAYEVAGELVAFVFEDVDESYAETVESVGHLLDPADFAFALDTAGIDLEVEEELFAGIDFTKGAEARAFGADILGEGAALDGVVMERKPRADRLLTPVKTPPFAVGCIHCSSPIKNK